MSDDLQAKLTQLEKAIAEQKKMLGDVLSAEQLADALRPLQEAKAAIEAQLAGGGAIATEGSTAVSPRGVNVGGNVGGSVLTGDISGNVYLGKPTDDPQEALRIYRQVLIQSSGALPLRGVDVGASDPASAQSSLGLAHVYIDLDTMTQVALSAKERKKAQRAALSGEKETKPLPALQAAVANRQLVLLGDPGGGKTTFVHHLAHCLAANALHPDADWLTNLPGWPQHEADLLPIIVILRDFARSLPKSLPPKALPKHLWEFIADSLTSQNLDFAAEPMRHTLESGKAILLLDGLDEIPTQAQRIFVRDAVNAFVTRHPGNRVLVTCRVLSYQPPATSNDIDLRLSEKTFLPFELAPFTAEKTDNFIAAWYKELARGNVVKSQDVDGLIGKFQRAVRRADLWRLAPNPLLLTVMALVHSHKGRLPDARALLYEETVDILLWRWEQIKSGGQEDAPQLRQLLLQANLSDMDLKNVLWQLAFDAHRQVDGDADTEKVADIGELTLIKALAGLNADDLTWGGKLVKAMKMRAGLLLERVPEVFTFPHRTFQEYLAGAHLSTLSNFSEVGTTLAEEGALWREVILLAVGRLVYLSGMTDKPLALVAELCPSTVKDDPTSWANAWLAGDVLLEIGLHRASKSSLGRDLLARVRDRIATLVAAGKLTVRQRAEAGDTLARLGDPRRGVGVHVVKGVRLPDIELCYVPPGPFWMGSGDDDAMADDNEKPLHQQNVPYGYWIGRFPVTVAQFKLFVEQSGYRNFSTLALDDPQNRPVRYVTWYDALEFCRWLEGAWRQQGWLPDGTAVTLPSEMEWEKAARGGVQLPENPLLVSDINSLRQIDSPDSLIDNPMPHRRFPWGNEPDVENGNSKETGLSTTNVVGAFPGGISPYGILSMSGHVFEWTRTIWGKSYSKPDYNYPYQPEDGRESLQRDNKLLRVIRGGSWAVDETWLRCADRYGDGPSNRSYDLGFRIVVSPFFTAAL